MTLLGPDLSNFQAGLDISALPHPFVLAKASEGTTYADASYPHWHAQAAAAGKIFVAYHFVTAANPAAQAAHLRTCIGDPNLPVMLDWEPEGSYHPPLSQLLAVADAVKAAKMRPRLAYAPRWHWESIGSPSLAGLAQRGIGLVSSAYPGGTGYPGDSATGWDAYGGVTPVLYQYTDHAPIQGQSVDMNAYRGTAAQLAALLGGDPMGTIPAAIGQAWPEIAGQFPAGGQFDDETALIWADGGARAAAFYSKQARDAVATLAAKVQTPPAIDVKALAAALAPLLTAGATADEIAAAVVAHVATAIAKG